MNLARELAYSEGTFSAWFNHGGRRVGKKTPKRSGRQSLQHFSSVLPLPTDFGSVFLEHVIVGIPVGCIKGVRQNEKKH